MRLPKRVEVDSRAAAIAAMLTEQTQILWSGGELRTRAD